MQGIVKTQAPNQRSCLVDMDLVIVYTVLDKQHFQYVLDSAFDWKYQFCVFIRCIVLHIG